MREQPRQDDVQPWYRQGWPWALIALPASAVIGGIITITLAVQSPNALVADDYYKQGLAINQEKRRLASASAMEMQGLLRYDGQHIQLELDGTLADTTDILTLQIIHATRADLDRSLSLQRRDNTYLGELEGLQAGNWYLRLQPTSQAWEIRGKISADGAFQTRLTAQD